MRVYTNETKSPTVISLQHVMMKCSCLLKANHCEYKINYASLYERDKITDGDIITTCNDEMQLLVEGESLRIQSRLCESI